MCFRLAEKPSPRPPEINPIDQFSAQVSKRILDRNHKDKVISALQRLEYNGGSVSDQTLR